MEWSSIRDYKWVILMSESAEKVEVLCQQYLLEAEGDPTLAYSLMRLEYSILEKPVPVKDFVQFKQFLGMQVGK